MASEILGDKKPRRYDEGLVDKVNDFVKNGGRFKRDYVFPPVDINSVEFEFGKSSVLSYDAALSSIRKFGFERFLRPAEYVALLLECKKNLRSEKKALVELMNDHTGEWLSCAIQKDKDELTVYLDPENLVLSGKKYMINGKNLVFKEKYVFDIDDLPSKQLIHLDKLPKEFIQLMYGVNYEELPHDLKCRSIKLNEDGVISPVSTGGDLDESFDPNFKRVLIRKGLNFEEPLSKGSFFCTYQWRAPRGVYHK